MKLKSLFLILIAAIIAISCENGENEYNKVKHAGNLEAVMNGDMDATIALQDIKKLPHVYALGVLEDLKGEIQIFDGKSYISRKTENMLSIDTTFNASAAFLVYAQVKDWQVIPIPKAIISQKQLAKYIEGMVKKEGLDTSKPFPFLISGYVRKMDWHIVYWDENNSNHEQDHLQYGLQAVFVDKVVEVLGFYSNDTSGSFTKGNAKIHLHFKVDDKLAGHTDDMILGSQMKLKIPKQKS